jgi:hypothetical protein
LALNLSQPNTHIFEWWFNNTLSVIDVTVGATVASRRPENPVGWLLLLSGAAVSLGHFSSQYAIYALLAQPNTLPAGEALAWIASWLLPIYSGLPVFYLLLFPTGRLPSRRWRWLAWLTAAYKEIVTGSSGGPLTTVANTRGEFGSFGFRPPSLNNEGDVAFHATLDDFSTSGIFVGPDPVGDRVIATGDTLDGATVQNLTFCEEGLSDSGQLAFTATFEDPDTFETRVAVFRATPLP